jgi:hypothetical protein
VFLNVCVNFYRFLLSSVKNINIILCDVATALVF